MRSTSEVRIGSERLALLVAAVSLFAIACGSDDSATPAAVSGDEPTGTESETICVDPASDPDFDGDTAGLLEENLAWVVFDLGAEELTDSALDGVVVDDPLLDGWSRHVPLSAAIHHYRSPSHVARVDTLAVADWHVARLRAVQDRDGWAVFSYSAPNSASTRERPSIGTSSELFVTDPDGNLLVQSELDCAPANMLASAEALLDPLLRSGSAEGILPGLIAGDAAVASLLQDPGSSQAATRARAYEAWNASPPSERAIDLYGEGTPIEALEGYKVGMLHLLLPERWTAWDVAVCTRVSLGWGPACVKLDGISGVPVASLEVVGSDQDEAEVVLAEADGGYPVEMASLGFVSPTPSESGQVAAEYGYRVSDALAQYESLSEVVDALEAGSSEPWLTPLVAAEDDVD